VLVNKDCFISDPLLFDFSPVIGKNQAKKSIINGLTNYFRC